MISRKTNREKFLKNPIHLAIFLLFCLGFRVQAKLSVLVEPPDWSRLDKFQKTITRDKFDELLQKYYAPNGAAYGYVWIDTDHALIRKKQGEADFYTLEFAPSDKFRREVPVTWRPVIPGQLQGRKITLDPGHLGGDWAKMEERWFQIGDKKPVTEGDMTLIVAKKIARKLREAGAIVSFVRETPEPLTGDRPEGLRKEAAESLRQQGLDKIQPSYENTNEPRKQSSIQWEAERLFYRLSEIHARAIRNNIELRPDLTICLHFNALSWDAPTNPTFVEENHVHLLINGQYGADELAYDDQRIEMIEKLLSQSIGTEVALSKIVARQLAADTGLPPFIYHQSIAGRVTDDGYIWTRNLLANRLYHNPTLYLEPYVMNNQEVFDRVQMGDYEGTKEIDGVPKKSIYNEYADAVVEALTQPAK